MIRIALVIGSLGETMAAVATIQGNRDRFDGLIAVIVAGVVRFAIAVMIVWNALVMAVFTRTVAMITVAGIGARPAFRASTSPTDKADDCNGRE